MFICSFTKLIKNDVQSVSNHNEYFKMFLYLPKSILIEIYQYNPEHREMFNESLLLIPKVYADGKILSVMKEHPNKPYYHLAMEHYIRYFLDDAEYILKIFSNCKCCIRHQIRRPISLNEPNNTPPFGISFRNNEYNNTCRCGCWCRSISRIMCRALGEIAFDDTFGEMIDYDSGREWFEEPFFYN